MPSFRTTRRVPFTPRQMFDLVADVERYPRVPAAVRGAGRAGSASSEGDKEVLIADMTVGYQAIRETFTSRVTLDPARWPSWRSVPEYRAGRSASWRTAGRFAPAPGGCDVDFFIAYEFKSMLLQMLVGGLFDRVFRRYTRAFEERAHAVYGARQRRRPASRAQLKR